MSKRWLLIRGLTRSRFHWFDFPEYLKRELKLDTVEMAELAGNGYRSQEPSFKTIDQNIDDIRKQFASIQKPVSILAISMGGMVAMRWAERFPDEIDQLVIINSSSALSPFYKRLKPNAFPGIVKALASSSAEAIEKFIMQTTVNQTQAWQPKFKELVEFQKQNPVSLRNFLTQILISRNFQMPVEKPAAKVLILTSEADRLVSHECSVQIANYWQVPIEIHPSAGHDLPLDDWKWIITQIQKHKIS